MRKSLLINLLLAMLLGATSAWADSGLYICGEEVSSTSNWSLDVTNNISDCIKSGTISYDAASKTVTFDNINVVGYGKRVLYNKNVSGLKIVFVGSAYLFSHYCVFRLDQDTEIIGSEELVEFSASGSDTQCIYCPNKTKLIIRDFGMLKMISLGWRALHTKGTDVSIINSRIYAEGHDCAIQNDEAWFGDDINLHWHWFEGDLHFSGCLIRDPWYNCYGSVGEGYDGDSVTKPLVHTSKAKSVMIIRSEDYLGVRLKGIALTKGWSINTDTSNPSYGIEDYYTYNESTNTLTLKGDIRAKKGYGDKMKNLRDWIGIRIDRPITIEGNGCAVFGQRGITINGVDATLNNINVGGTDAGIYVNEGNLTLKDDILIAGEDCAIEFYSITHSYYSNGAPKDVDYYGNVTFNPSLGKTITLAPCNSNYRETDSFDEQAIIGDKAKLESCIITTPEGAEMRSYGFMFNGAPVKTKTVFTGVTMYGLEVGERKVTSANASDILGDGHFKYDASTNTLTVTNAKLETERGIRNEIDGLNVNFVGASTFTTEIFAIMSEKSINLIGDGSLKANVTASDSGIYLPNGDPITCTINGPQLDLTVKNGHTIFGSNTTLNVMGSTTCLRLHPGDRAAIYVDALNLETVLHISQPEGGYFSPHMCGITVDGTSFYKGDVVIETDQNRKLGFSINGTEMTALNMNNVPGVESGSAHVEEATPGKPILVLNNAVLDWNDADDALNLKSGTELTIRVLGDCVINAPDHAGLNLSGNTTITGGGTLRINSKWAAISNWEDTKFTLQNNTTLIAHSSDSYGYCDDGYDYDQQKSWFIIKDGALFAAFGELGPISLSSDRTINFDSYTELRYPVGGHLGNDGYVYDADGNEVKNDWAVIGPSYVDVSLGFSINGKDMMAFNANDVPGVTTGNAYIDASTSGSPILVLDNATLDWDDAKEALNLQAGKKLTIKVLGDCTINDGLSISGNATITGGGTLRINSTGAAIETFDETSFTIRDNTKVVAHSSGWLSYLDSGNNNGAYCTIESGCVFAAYGPGSFNPFMFGSRSATLGEGIGIRYPESCQLRGAFVYYVSEYDFYEITNDWVVFGPENDEATAELIEELVSGRHKFDFSINGTEMTSENMSDVPGLISGNAYVEEDASGAPTLVLNNATLEWNEAAYGLHNLSGVQSGLTIRVLGECSISVPNAIALELDLATQTTITGGGTLNISSGQSPVEIWGATTLRIQEGTTVIAKSETDYCALWDHNGANIEISDGGLLAAFGKYEPILLNSNSQFVLGEGIALRYPVDAIIGSRNICYADGSEVTNNWVVIGPDNEATQGLIEKLMGESFRKLGFSINDVEMTDANMAVVPGLVSGNALIEESEDGSITLVLDNATLEWNEAAYGLHNYGASELTISVLGDCTIKAPAGVALELDESTLTTISGDGTLNITSGSYPIETKSSTTKLQFNGATVIAQSETMGSALWDEGGASICFGGGTFASYGTSEPIHLSASGEFVFSEGIDFRYPVGAYIGIGNRIYNADDVKVEGNWVVIGPDNEATQDLITGVDEIASSRQPAGNGFIYNLAGQQIVNGKWSNGKLPRGIYIQNGKKILRK